MTDTAAAAATAASTKKRALPQDQPDQARKQRKTSPASPAPPPPPPSSDPPRTTKVPTKFAGHTRKERKQNRSTRIHSLRKLLGRETLPSTIRQEKERELAALVHEQSANKSKKEGRKVLEKYHYVRFVERRKAEKKLRQLEKQLEVLESGDGDDDDDQRAKLQRRIHEMEVHKNYAIYAPLNQKYVSIFVQNASGSRSDTSDQETSGIARKRPSLWYTVESAMKQGEKELELLRDGRSRLSKQETHIARDVNEKGTNGKSPARSDKDSSQKTTARQARSVQHEPGESEASDDDFFER